MLELEKKYTYNEVEKEVLGIDKAANINLLRELWKEKIKLKRENTILKKEVKRLKK